MQEETTRRSNRERTETTRQALMDAARALFISKGYADTSTPDICASTATTRGALYHHFTDKRDLFRQVVVREVHAITADIVAATPARLKPREALIAGSDAYLKAMSVPGRTRLLLIDGPAVLGTAEIMAIDEENAAKTLRQGLRAAMPGAEDGFINALSNLLSAAFDRAALEMDAGGDADEIRATLLWLLKKTLG
ncbi:MAG TPA: helix-turn-helix domain-containing protein [Polaromonas sp.]|uniref:TetR/AcrR family transcriptional regulator n=1 Tax=Polaromonas sp. TaxID=1869339 RepID=UPI002D733C36|nr:helix-turn-helix domain-containing protein [Polaromonas sp.]HYW57853.1 helix-turn-helix domain-containing protein [Polaromonas sp.]